MSRKVIIFCLIVLCPALLSAANTDWKYTWYSKGLVESADKDYNIESTDLATGLSLLTPAKDRTLYFSNYVDASFKMSNDLSRKSVLDFSDSLQAQYYNLEDYNSIDEDSYKYTYINNLFLTSFGYSFNKEHSMKIDLEHTYYQFPAADELNNSTIRGNLGLTKNFSKDFSTTLAFEGKAGRYPNENTDDFDESSVSLNLYHYFPEVVHRIAVTPARRFDSNSLSKDARGFDYEMVYDYNSEFSEERKYNSRPEVYKTSLVRGDFYLSLDLDFDNRRLINSTGESYLQGMYTFTTGYNINDSNSIRLTDTYVDLNYQAESEILLNFSQVSNDYNINFSSTVSDYFNFNLTHDSAYYQHKNFSNQDYTLKTTTIDLDYHPNKLNYFLSLSWEDKDFTDERLYYPSHFKQYITFILRYALTSRINFKFRDDYSELDYGTFEDSVYSSNKQNIYTVSLDVGLGDNYVLETGFYFLDEKNQTYTVNDETERTVFFNWQTTY